MDDPVLHRKMFRHKALRTGILKPKSYQVGAPGYGVSAFGPFLTNESQGFPEEKVFYKDGKRYTVDRYGNVKAVEYMPAKYKGPGMSTKIAEAFLDPIKAYKEGTYGQLGRSAVEGIKSIPGYAKTAAGKVVSGAKKAGSLAKGIGVGVAGYTGAEDIAEAVGGETGKSAVEAAGLTSLGADLTRAGLQKFAPNLAARAPNLIGVLSAAGAPFRYLTNPVIAAPLFVAGKTASEIAKGRQRLLEARKQYGTEDMVPTALGDAPREYVNQLASELPDISGEASILNIDQPISGSDLQTKGEIPSGQTDQGQGTGGTTGGGTKPPSGADVIPAGGQTITGSTTTTEQEKLIAPKPKPENLLEKNLETDLKQKKNLPPEAKNWSDKLYDFARTGSGSAFMLKFAAGLLSGKGNFGEVVGNALNPAVDLFTAYRLKEDELLNKNLIEQMKLARDLAKDKEISLGNFPVTQQDGTVQYYPAEQDKKSKQVTVRLPDGKSFTPPAEQFGLFANKSDVNAKDLNDAYNQYSSIIQSQALLHMIKVTPDEYKGTPGAIKNLFNIITGVGKGGIQSFQQAKFDLKFASEEEKKMFDKLDSKAETLAAKVFDKKSIEQLGGLKVAAVNLKYYLANALKDKDRLTQNDLKRIDELFDVLSFTGVAADINAKIDGVQSLLSDKLQQSKLNLRRLGQNDADFMVNFMQNDLALRAAGLAYATSAGQWSSDMNKIDLQKFDKEQRQKYLQQFFK